MAPKQDAAGGQESRGLPPFWIPKLAGLGLGAGLRLAGAGLRLVEAGLRLIEGDTPSLEEVAVGGCQSAVELPLQ